MAGRSLCDCDRERSSTSQLGVGSLALSGAGALRALFSLDCCSSFRRTDLDLSAAGLSTPVNEGALRAVLGALSRVAYRLGDSACVLEYSGLSCFRVWGNCSACVRRL